MDYRIIDLISTSIKNLGIPSFDRKNENENNLMKQEYEIARILKIWRTRNLTIEGKITIIEIIAISKMIQVALVSNSFRLIVDQLNKVQKELM